MSLYTALTQVLAPFAAKIKGIQTGYDGTVYPNPGTAVREQIKALHVLIGDAPGAAIQASAVAYNNSNVAAELTNVNGRLDEQGEDILELQNGGYVADQQQIGQKINTWLNDHPEATTTVLDGSLTESKFSDALKRKTIKEYVTPQMYGAIGDGISDDTEAIQSALNSGKSVFFGTNTYKITQTISISNKKLIHLDASGCRIIYSGEEYAFNFKNISYCQIDFNKIEATNGGCMRFCSDISEGDGHCIINRITFKFLTATTNCICMEQVSGTLSENTFVGGVFNGGVNGVYFDKGGSGHCKFYDIDITPVSNAGFYFDDTVGEKSYADIFMAGIRTAETLNTITIKNGVSATRFLIVDSYGMDRYKITANELCTNWKMISASTEQRLINGRWMVIGTPYSLNLGSLLTEGEDLNNVTIPGRYYTNTGGLTTSLLNRPPIAGLQFSMIVEQVYSGQIIQTIVPKNSHTFWRRYVVDSVTYGEWMCLSSMLVKKVESEAITFEAGETKYVTIDATYSGYSAVGLLSFTTPGSTKLEASGWHTGSRTSVTIKLTNTHTSPVTSKVIATILYVPYVTSDYAY